MNTKIEEMRRQAQEDDKRLRHVEGQLFQSGKQRISGVPGLSVLVQPQGGADRPNLHLVAVGIHPPVRPVLRELACGVLNIEGQVFTIGRTNVNGMLWVDLPPGEYRLRFVDDVRDEVDIEILNRLADPLAQSQLAGADISDGEETGAGSGSPAAGNSPDSTIAAFEGSLSTGAPAIDSHDPVDLSSRLPLEVWQDKKPTMDFTEALRGAIEDTPENSLETSGDEWIRQKGRYVSLLCPINAIPHGLCWLRLIERDQSETWYLPTLQAVGDEWEWHEQIRDIFGGNEPCSPVTPLVIPATTRNFELFDTEEVHNFVRELPPDSLQRKLAEQFLEKRSRSDV